MAFQSQNSCYEEDRATIAANNEVEKVSQTARRKKGVDTIVTMRKLVIKLSNIRVRVSNPMEISLDLGKFCSI